MGNINSTRWRSYKKRRTVESCHCRINAREASHVGAKTTTTPVANTTARRLWCLCECGRRVAFLYKLPDEASAWKCRFCHRLTNRKTQEKGTRAAFSAWLTAKRWEEACKHHSATETMYERMGKLWGKNVAPYQWEKLNAEQQAELLRFYASPEAVRRVFEQQRAAWSEETERLAQEAGAQVKADLWKMWKQRNRSSKLL